jgi:peptidoglycan/LPS O-acetylase OafA/YrhL
MGIFRLWLASVVLLSHAPFGVAGQPLFGATAVSSFFVVSGFYMQLLLSERFGVGAAVDFYASRLLRIFPLYWLALFLSLLLVAHPAFDLVMRSGDPRTIAFALFENLFLFGQDFARLLYLDTATGSLSWSQPAAYDYASNIAVLGQAWTLSMELMFYLLAPVLLRWRTLPLVVIVIATIACRIFLPLPEIRAFWATNWIYGFFPNELGTFLLGSLGYRFYRHSLKGIDWSPTASAIAVAVLGVLIGYGFILNCKIHAYHYLYIGVTALAVPLLFAATRHYTLDRRIGELSYPVYLFHIIVVEQLGRVVASQWLGALALVVTIAFSIPLVAIVELPIERYRARAFG